MFPDKSRDYVISISESDIVLVKELKTPQENKSVEEFAKSIVDTALSEFYLKATVGIGSVVSSIKSLRTPSRTRRSPLRSARYSTPKNPP